MLPRLDTAELVRRYESGETLTKIASYHGCAVGPVWTRLRGAGVAMRPRGARAGNHHPKPFKKLDTESYRELLEALRAGHETFASLGRRFGVSRQRVQQIAKGRRHLTAVI